MAAATLLLDLDGTVWDSRPWYSAAIVRLSDASAREIETELAGGANLVRVAGEHGVSRARLVRAAREKPVSVDLYDGVRQTLERLRERETLLGIVTNLPGWLVEPLLESTGIDQYFAATATPRWGLPAKPKPHGIWKVLKQMGREADAETWFVGDGAADAEAAHAAGVQFAWASYGYESEPWSGAARVLACFEDVLQL